MLIKLALFEFIAGQLPFSPSILSSLRFIPSECLVARCQGKQSTYGVNPSIVKLPHSLQRSEDWKSAQSVFKWKIVGKHISHGMTYAQF
jgi:hypothetical protein